MVPIPCQPEYAIFTIKTFCSCNPEHLTVVDKALHMTQVCDSKLPMPGPKPVPCESPMCAFAFDELGLGSGIHELYHSPAVADLLIAVAAAALQPDQPLKTAEKGLNHNVSRSTRKSDRCPKIAIVQ